MTASTINSIRTIYWFFFIAKKLRLEPALAIQRLVDPKTIKTDGDKEIYHSSKWSEYRRGKHQPKSAALINQVDIRVPGSAAILHHLLWEVLERKRINPHFSKLLTRLNPEIQLLIIDIHGQPMMHASKQFLGKLERRASIDTLAALTLLMRVNYERGHPERAWEYAHSIFRVLLILRNNFTEFEIAEPLFQIFSARIFSLASWDGKRFALDNYTYYVQSILLFRRMESASEIDTGLLTLYDQSRRMHKLLELDASNIKTLFAPRIELI